MRPTIFVRDLGLGTFLSWQIVVATISQKATFREHTNNTIRAHKSKNYNFDNTYQKLKK